MNEHDFLTEDTREAEAAWNDAAGDVEAVIDPEGSAPTMREPAHLPILRQLTVALSVLVIVFGVTYVGTLTALVKPDSAQSSDVMVSKRIIETDESPVRVSDSFNGTKIAARAAFVWDVKKERVLFNKNADEQLPLASITKLMTALVAYELLGLDATIPITIDAIRTDGDSGFTDGETFSFQNLTDLTLMSSSNDGAVALGAAAANSIAPSKDPNKLFVEAMNLRAEELGLLNTHFENATGLDLSDNAAGAVGSARDVSFLMEYIITHYPDIMSLTGVDTTTIDNDEGAYHAVSNTNEVVRQIDGLIASKTGFTTLAGGNLVVVFNAGFNRPIIVTVLGSTQNERFTDVLELVKRAREYAVQTSE